MKNALLLFTKELFLLIVRKMIMGAQLAMNTTPSIHPKKLMLYLQWSTTGHWPWPDEFTLHPHTHTHTHTHTHIHTFSSPILILLSIHLCLGFLSCLLQTLELEFCINFKLPVCLLCASAIPVLILAL